MNGFRAYALAYFFAFVSALSFVPKLETPSDRLPASNLSCNSSLNTHLNIWFDESPGRTAIRSFRMRKSMWNLGSAISRRRDLILNHLMIKMDHRYPAVAFDQVARYNGMAKYYLGGLDEVTRNQLLKQLTDNNRVAASKLDEILKSEINTEAAENIRQLRNNTDLTVDEDDVLNNLLDSEKYSAESLKLSAQTRAQLKRLDVEIDKNNSPMRTALKADQESKKIIKEALSVEEIPTELMKKLDIVEGFQADINRFVKDRDQLEILKVILEKKLKDSTIRPGKIEIHLPQEVAARLLNDSIRDDRMVSSIVRNSKVDIAIDLKKINSLIGSTHQRANQRGYEQAILVKELETAKAEIERFKVDFKSPAQIPEVLQILERRLDAMFVDDSARALKPELAPPRWTWDKLTWISLIGESKALFLTKLPEKLDKSKIIGLYKYIDSLSEAERRSMGIHKVWSMTKWFNLSNKARVGITSGLFTGGTGMLAVGWKGVSWGIDRVYWKKKAKEECAEKEGSAFVECAFEYLQMAFPQRGELSDDALLRALTNSGSVNHPAMQAEIADLLRRRNQFLAALNRKENMKEPIKIALAQGDLGSPDYKNYLINIPSEKEFYAKMFAQDQSKGFLMNRYPLFFIRPEVKFAIKSAYNAKPDLRSSILTGMKKSMQKNSVVDQMIAEIEEILSGRDALYPREIPDSIENPKKLSEELHKSHNEGHMLGDGKGPTEITITTREEAEEIIQEIPKIAASANALKTSEANLAAATEEIIEELPPSAPPRR
jgi:hypothetical protein